MIRVTELWTFRITGHRDAEVITEILVDAPRFLWKNASMKVDAFEHLEVTHHRNLGISRTSLVMSRQVVDKELHQIQSAAETTLCGSPLLLACTEPWTSVDFRGLSDFSIKNNYDAVTTCDNYDNSWPRGGSPRSATMLRTPSLSENPQWKKCESMRKWEHAKHLFWFLRNLRQDASCNPSEHSGSSSSTKACHETFWLLKSFWGANQARGIFSNFAHKNC